ncbi:YkvA family protein [Paracidovorax citrulli]
MQWIDKARQWARRLRQDALTLWFSRSHPDTPWHAKAMAVAVVAYALSPIDLIPDFIPVLGYLDEVILLPALIWLTMRLLPQHVLLASRQRAHAWLEAGRSRPRSTAGAIAIVLLWILAAAGCLVALRAMLQ